MTTTSLSIMHQMPAPTFSTSSTMHSSLAPTPSDLRASIPIRTSSIRTKTTIIVSPPTTTTTTTTSSLKPPRPTSQCSSVHSAFSVSGSLDHRTMTRTPAQSSLKPRPVHARSSSLDTAATLTARATAAAVAATATTQAPLATSVPKQSIQSNSPTAASTTASNERSAFLTSAPVRSRVQIISPRFKNMSPASSANHNISALKFSTATTGSVTSLPSSLRCCPLSMGVCCSLGGSGGRCGVLNLNKRRWSNDSTRGLHGAAPLLVVPPVEKSEDEEDALSGTTVHDDYFNDNDNDNAIKAHCNNINNNNTSNNNNNNNKNITKTKNKKRCPTLAWFNFMLRK